MDVGRRLLLWVPSGEGEEGRREGGKEEGWEGGRQRGKEGGREGGREEGLIGPCSFGCFGWKRARGIGMKGEEKGVHNFT